jgi:hypothetical protein
VPLIMSAARMARYSSVCLNTVVAQVRLPVIPEQCRLHHPWGPGLVDVSWEPCDCPQAQAGRGGHIVVRCRAELWLVRCSEEWRAPPHQRVRNEPLGPSPSGIPLTLQRRIDLQMDRLHYEVPSCTSLGGLGFRGDKVAASVFAADHALGRELHQDQSDGGAARGELPGQLPFGGQSPIWPKLARRDQLPDGALYVVCLRAHATPRPGEPGAPVHGASDLARQVAHID